MIISARKDDARAARRTRLQRALSQRNSRSTASIGRPPLSDAANQGRPISNTINYFSAYTSGPEHQGSDMESDLTQITPFPFLLLSPETRNEVYKLCVTLKAVSDSDELEAESLLSLDDLVSPPIARVSRQLRSESLPVFFDVNKFYVLLWKDAEDVEEDDDTVNIDGQKGYEMRLLPSIRHCLEREIGLDTPVFKKIGVLFDERSILKDTELELQVNGRSKQETMTHGEECLACSTEGAV